MKICMLFEGCYPHITGGVSTWAHILVKNIDHHQFLLYTISAESRYQGKFKYDLPDNIISVQEIFLDKILEGKGRYGKKFHLSRDSRESLKALIIGNDMEWEPVLEMIKKKVIRNSLDFFMSMDFFDILRDAYSEKYAKVPFTDFFWTIRSMFLPLFFLMQQPVPEADLYHSASNGYTGFVGVLAKYIYKKPFILTEHGIYSREREEEIIKSSWISGQFKDLWINFFKNISKMVYQYADGVYTLFEKNKEIEVELGCPEDKIKIIPNGIYIEDFQKGKYKGESKVINIGSITRIAPIKDIKTLIQSFNIVKRKIGNTKLYIMGPIDDYEDYYNGCRQLVERLKLEEDIRFTGRVDIGEYIGRMDILVLTSISEGQPFVILEGMAAEKPFIATDVGACRELIYGHNDRFGKAGLITPMMNSNQIASAIIRLCQDRKMREVMGSNGEKRVRQYYTAEKCVKSYRELYDSFSE